MTESPPAPTTQAPPPAATPSNEPAPAFSDFDATFSDGLDAPEVKPVPASPEKAVPPAEGRTGNDTKPAKPVTPEPKKGEDAKASPEKPETTEGQEETAGEVDEYTPPKVATEKQTRGWALSMGKRAKRADMRAQELEMRVKQLEAQPPRQAEATSNMAAELAEAKKKLDQYENDLRLTKYERSGEYQEKYQKPYQAAVSRAYREVKELLVSEPKPNSQLDENGKPTEYIDRQATQADFDELYGMPLGPATRLAKQKFGDAAMIVLQHRQNIRQLAEQAFEAVEAFKGKASQVETQTKAQEAQRAEGMLRMFNFASEAHAKKNAEMFLPRDGDTEGNELLTKGRDFATSVFAGNDGLAPQQVAMRDARALNWLTAYPRLARDVKKLRGELDAANKTIEELRGSSPGKPTPSVEAPAKTAGSILDDFDKNVL